MAVGSQRAMQWLRFAATGGVCLGLGIAVGMWWPKAAAPAWRDGSVLGPAGPPATFADIVAAARPGVVTVRALVPGPGLDPVAEAAAEPVAKNGGPRITDARGEIQAREGRETTATAAIPDAGYRNGSGFVCNTEGLIVTSRHIVVGAASIEVIVPQRGVYNGLLVGEDEATDIAIVRIENPPADLHALPLGSSEKLRAGDWIVAVGNPYGFAQTVTAGVVSFVGRHLAHSDLAVTSDFLQISAPVNPGSSGCPVLDMHGCVVGVTSQAAVHAQGISFAVPSRTLKWTLDAMSRSEDGLVRRGYLGIEFATRADTDEKGNPCGGVVIVRVVEGAPAELAGIQSGDIIVSVDGTPIADATVLHERIVQGQPGGHIALQVLREGRLRDPIEAVLSELTRAKLPVVIN